ncbi:MAG TPA: biotin/lipoyl-binding protein, partial [Terriglobales bacterium]|nr:biotin/lipoyl-binding protein [Terriglobales bacterium]
MILGFHRKPTGACGNAALAATLAAGLLFFGCSQKKQPPVEARVPVTVADVVQKTVPVQVRVIGNVDPYTTVGVKPQITGEIVGVHFTEGQDVKKGQLLFTLDPRPFEADLLRAQ